MENIDILENLCSNPTAKEWDKIVGSIASDDVNKLTKNTVITMTKMLVFYYAYSIISSESWAHHNFFWKNLVPRTTIQTTTKYMAR